MNRVQETFGQLSALPRVTVLRDLPLSGKTRFGLGGPADIFFETADTASFIDALRIAKASGLETVVIGSGTNLIASDEGFRGVVLKLASDGIGIRDDRVLVQSGTLLQTLVDATIAAGLKGLETMTGIPGSVGAAIYGNAGAYGHSIMERIQRVRFFDGETSRECDREACEFRYRESVFKRHKSWIILDAELALEVGDVHLLQETSARILGIRNQKYPPTMKCAGSIFKNFLLAELPAAVAAQIPETVIIEGKVPSAWFLEHVGAKGMRVGDIQVADYHANLIYNDGNGTAEDLVSVIRELKRRVAQRWGVPLEEEVQYLGFAAAEIDRKLVTV